MDPRRGRRALPGRARDRPRHGPPGLSNDAAEETLRGLRLLDAGTFTPVTSVIGNSVETGYVYLAALVFELLGGGTLAVHLPGWACAVATVVGSALLARRIAPRLPMALAALFPATSLWLFHYGRTGLRAIASPLVVVLLALALDRLGRVPACRRTALGAGAIAAAGVYAYTACRVVAVALAVAMTVWIVTAPPRERGARVTAVAWVLAAALAVSLPNLVFAARSPAEFFARGAYVLPPADEVPANLVASVLLPLHYPARFADVARRGWFFDGVSASFASLSARPVGWIPALALLFGLPALASRWREPAPALLLATWATAVAALGPSGPSLTRWLVVLPVFLAGAAAGLDSRGRRETLRGLDGGVLGARLRGPRSLRLRVVRRGPAAARPLRRRGHGDRRAGGGARERGSERLVRRDEERKHDPPPHPRRSPRPRRGVRVLPAPRGSARGAQRRRRSRRLPPRARAGARPDRSGPPRPPRRARGAGLRRVPFGGRVGAPPVHASRSDRSRLVQVGETL